MAVNWKRFFNFVAFVAVVLLGISLMLAHIFKSNGDVKRAFDTIALVMASLVVAFYSFFYAWSRSRKVWYGQLLHMLIWVAAVVLIVVFILLPLF